MVGLEKTASQSTQNGITLITITSHFPTETVSRTAARGCTFLRSLTKLFVQDFLEDVLAEYVQRYGHIACPDLTISD
jgi:hypothetical protein